MDNSACLKVVAIRRIAPGTSGASAISKPSIVIKASASQERATLAAQLKVAFIDHLKQMVQIRGAICLTHSVSLTLKVLDSSGGGDAQSENWNHMTVKVYIEDRVADEKTKKRRQQRDQSSSSLLPPRLVVVDEHFLKDVSTLVECGTEEEVVTSLNVIGDDFEKYSAPFLDSLPEVSGVDFLIEECTKYIRIQVGNRRFVSSLGLPRKS